MQAGSTADTFNETPYVYFVFLIIGDDCIVSHAGLSSGKK